MAHNCPGHMRRHGRSWRKRTPHPWHIRWSIHRNLLSPMSRPPKPPPPRPPKRPPPPPAARPRAFEDVRAANLRYIRDAGIRSVEVNVVYAVATKPRDT